MATVTHVCTIEYVAKMLGEDQELLEAIVCNDDNLRVPRDDGHRFHGMMGTDSTG